MEAAFRRYFHRASPEQKKDSYEVLVCHANIIRYLLLRALQLPPQAWNSFALPHCGVSIICINPVGEVFLFSFGDVGFFPKNKRSMNRGLL